jgi:hypothetical protein
LDASGMSVMQRWLCPGKTWMDAIRKIDKTRMEDITCYRKTFARIQNKYQMHGDSPFAT